MNNYYDIIWGIIFMNMYVNFTIHVENRKESTMHAVDYEGHFDLTI